MTGALLLLAAAGLSTVTLDPSVELGPVKPMNCVNNGPLAPDKSINKSNFHWYRLLRIPYARTHDANICRRFGAPHVVDVSAVFPDPLADENDPGSYDFVRTDRHLEAMRAAGTEPFYRLGPSAFAATKPEEFMPRDFAKYARVCEHIVRHYNEGWADGFRWNIRYWEIWNEPDLRADEEENVITPGASPFWSGSVDEFLAFFATVHRHLKSSFPALRFGGPGIADTRWWARRFVERMKAESVKLDFLSWHSYGVDPGRMAENCDWYRALLDENGFTGTESILNEWNYVKGWSRDWEYASEVMSGRHNVKAAAMIAATMCACQAKPLDLLMYYDARMGTEMNGMFDGITMEPLKGYYPFYAWAKLRDLGTAVRSAVAMAEDDGAVLFTAAAKDASGRLAVLVARYNEDNNVTWRIPVRIAVAGRRIVRAFAYVTDENRAFTEVPLLVDDDGTAEVILAPNAFAYVTVETGEK